MIIRIIGEVFDQFSQLNVGSRIYVKSSLRCKRKMTIQLIRVEAQRLWARLKNSVNDLPYFTWLVWVKRFLNKSFTGSSDSSIQFFPYWTKAVSLCMVLWASYLAVSLSFCRSLMLGYFIQGAGGLVTRILFKGASLSMHFRIRELRVSNCSSGSSEYDMMDMGSVEKFSTKDSSFKFLITLMCLNRGWKRGKRTLMQRRWRRDHLLWNKVLYLCL